MQAQNVMMMMNMLNIKSEELRRLEEQIRLHSQSNPVYVQGSLMPHYQVLVNEIANLQNAINQQANMQNTVNMQQNYRHSNNGFGFGVASVFNDNNTNGSTSFGDVNEELISDSDMPVTLNKLTDCYKGYSDFTNQYPNPNDDVVLAKEKISQLEEKLMEKERLIKELESAKMNSNPLKDAVVMGYSRYLVSDSQYLSTGMFDSTELVHGVKYVGDGDVNMSKQDGVNKAIHILVNLEVSELQLNDDIERNIDETVRFISWGLNTVVNKACEVIQPRFKVYNLAHGITVKEGDLTPDIGVAKQRLTNINKSISATAREIAKLNITTPDGITKLFNYVKKVIQFEGDKENDGFTKAKERFYNLIGSILTKRINNVYKYVIGRGCDLIVDGLDVESVEIILSEILCLPHLNETSELSPILNLSYKDLKILLLNIKDVMVERFENTSLVGEGLYSDSEYGVVVDIKTSENSLFIYTKEMSIEAGLTAEDGDNFYDTNITNIITNNLGGTMSLTPYTCAELFGVLEACRSSLENKETFRIVFVTLEGNMVFRAIPNFPKGTEVTEDSEYLLVFEEK